MGTTVVDVVPEDNRCLRFLQRHPQLHMALAPAIVGAYMLLVCWLIYTPPEFTASVSSFQGLDPGSRADAAPAFAVTLRARNHDAWRHCFLPGKGGSVVVSYAGVPLARGDLPGFCVPGRGVAKVRLVAAGEGLGVPDALHERMEAQRGRRERVALTVRVRLDDDLVVPHNLAWPMLLWCEAMMDGHPVNNGSSRCSVFLMTKMFEVN